MNYTEATEQMSKARDKSAGKPIANNTRLFSRTDGTVTIRLHNTDIVGINEDGTFTLAAGGWHTPTTLSRIREFSPAKLFSESGDWFLRSEPNPADPHPQRHDRTIPKPFEAADPGPEPVKSDDGCIAGSSTAEPYFDYEAVYDWRPNPEPQIYVTLRSYSDGSGSGTRMAYTAGIERIFYGEDRRGMDEGWMLLTGQVGKFHWDVRKITEVNGKSIEYKQCPHCKKFDNLHARWDHAMNGGGWGQDRFLGYAKRMELIERFGSVEAWHDAYLADFRARRAYLKAAKEWEMRNRIVFFDGILVNEDGYAIKLRSSGPSPAKLRRHEAKVNKIKREIDKYLNGYIEQLREGMPMPGSGDCWYCSMIHGVKPNDENTWAERGKSLRPAGEGENNEHLLNHIEESYYVPSLAVNAMRERGYKDVGIYMMLDMNPIRQFKKNVGSEPTMIGTDKMGGKSRDYDNVKRDIRLYLRKRLVPSAPTE